jgi:hypothetical protein
MSILALRDHHDAGHACSRSSGGRSDIHTTANLTVRGLARVCLRRDQLGVQLLDDQHWRLRGEVRQHPSQLLYGPVLPPDALEALT